jgi:peptidoglycan/LPS O-acetylase OafA/YrhL
MIPTFGQGSLFPLDVVYWSLFFELVVNGLYVVTRPGLTNRVLLVVVLLAGMSLLYQGRRFAGIYFGFEGEDWHFFGGFTRAVFGIFCGILLYRHKDRLTRLVPKGWGALVSMAVVSLCLTSPSIGRFNWAIDFLFVSVVFPVCILAAVYARPSRGLALMALLGAASYPLYLFHPLIAKVGMRFFPDLVALHAPFSGLLFLLAMVVFSVCIDHYMDVPFRRWLTRRLQAVRVAVKPA